ncbi:MAG TPA: GNAT family N-acetyltransferase [Roseiflexaceae bacterium]|nr:GNAT family N-acetyltransferase [Roseiflexaceae bacterium]
MNIRPISEHDHAPIVAVVDQWWGGRQMAGLLPRLFFAHFQDTSFAVEEDGRIIAFLIGFVSQTDPRQAYIHFVGIHPDYRKRGLGRQLYQLFFDNVRERGCQSVRCITAPINSGSIAFHRHMGFQIEKSDRERQGVPFTADYDGPGGDRVCFVKSLRLAR